jgi:hypothetical protein
MICRIVASLLPLTVYCRPNKKKIKNTSTTTTTIQVFKTIKYEDLISLALGHYPENLNPLGGGRWWNSTIEHKLGMVAQFGDTDLILGVNRYLKFCLPELFILTFVVIKYNTNRIPGARCKQYKQQCV